MSAKKTRRAPKKRTKRSPAGELDEWFRQYAYGLPLDISRVRKLAKSRRLRPEQRADAWKLVGYLHEGVDEFERAWNAYDRAVRTSKAISDEILMRKAVLIRNHAVESTGECCGL